MAPRAKSSKATKQTVAPPAASRSPLKMRKQADAFAQSIADLHIYGKSKTGQSKICTTNSRGYATPNNRSPAEIVVDASEGFIPLWARNVTLRWRFNEGSMRFFQNPTAAKTALRERFGQALLAWGDAMPVSFTESNDTWDFEIVMRNAENCTPNGCTLASAFFPDPGRHELVLYPTLLSQSVQEQVETLIHETGHIFGLRHFFANLSEQEWPSEIFGTHEPFSIMNYGAQSVLTENDRCDLKRLYQMAWSGELTSINGTNVVLVSPYHELISSTLPVGMAASRRIARGPMWQAGPGCTC